MRIKICCLCSASEVATALAGGADLLGFVAPPLGGMGVIAEPLIAELIRLVPPGVTPMLLTGHTDLRAIIEQVARCRPGAIQLVKATTPTLRGALRKRFPCLRILQVVHVLGPDALAEALRAEEGSDGVLLDSANPAAGQLGATGATHDWSISAKIVQALRTPVYLAGGLSPANIAEAIATVRPAGVDLCTGVRRDGRLDPARVAAFVAAARAAGSAL